MINHDENYFAPIDFQNRQSWWIDVDCDPVIASDHDWYILVPVTEVQTLSNDTMISSLRTCLAQLPEAKAENIAGAITSGEQEYDYQYCLDVLLPLKGESPYADEVIDILIERIEKEFSRYPTKASIGKRRHEIATSYEKTFIKLGRRDGFHCANCRSTHDIHIDHITPLAHGGTSDFDNLQLLCKTCNSSKGTKNIDYRNGGAK